MLKTNKYDIIGCSIIAYGIVFNEYTIKTFLKLGSQFNSPIKSILLVSVELVIIFIGVFIIRKKKQAIGELVVCGLSIIISLFVMELLLSMKAFDNLSSESPIWVPAKYKQISMQFSRIHNKKSMLNEYGFNDVNHTKVKKDKSIFRIAVLGDSFVWGAGVPDSIIWTHKLEKRILEKGIDCEILNWAKSGWSTLDEFNYLRNIGVGFQFDYLIFAFVVNDPVMDSSTHKDLITRNGSFERYVLDPISTIFPNDVSFFKDVMNNFVSTYSGIGYMKWLQMIYSDDNLERYSTLIKEIKQYCDTNKIQYCFVLTPENHSFLLKTYFDKVIPILVLHSVPYLDLYPYVSKELVDYPNRALWANPADGHPGNMVTEVYSKYIYEYLKNELPNQ
jgi:hypothetical protein